MMTPAERCRRWRLAHPDRHLAAVRKYQANNREKTLQAKRDWYQRNKKRSNEKSKLWRKAHRDRVSEKNRAMALKRYGVSLEEYKRLFSAQDGLCAICKTSMNMTKNLCVDHRHLDGKVRGLLCHSCNFVIGNAKDDCSILLAAIRYLEKFNGA